MNDGRWVDHETWDVIHSNPKTMQEQWMLDMVTSFTPAGIHAYDLKRAEEFRKANGQTLTVFDKNLHSLRNGFYGWMGFGGSVFQWNPEYKVGFSYVCADIFLLDLANK